jgi:hypothetical protein
MPYGDSDRIDWIERAGATVRVACDTPEATGHAVVSWDGRSVAGETVRQALDRAIGLDAYEPSRWQGRAGRPAREDAR